MIYMKKKICSDYCGVACIDGSCPNALLEDNPDYFVDVYGQSSKIKCSDCIYNEQCKDCCIPYYDDTVADVEDCKKSHKIE